MLLQHPTLLGSFRQHAVVHSLHISIVGQCQTGSLDIVYANRRDGFSVNPQYKLVLPYEK